MCLAIPAKIVEIDGEIAKVEIGGVFRLVSTILIEEKLHVEDYVITHAGFALHKIETEVALTSIKFLQKLAQTIPN